MNNFRASLSLLCAAAFAMPVFADKATSGAADHAPLGVMGDHLHAKGEVMLSYRYMHMAMDGNRSGTDELSAQQVREQGYNVVPVDMDMTMHMLGMMYGATDNLTLMLMVPYVSYSMNHRAGMDLQNSFKTESEALGDVKATGLYGLFENSNHQVHANVGLSLPTGNIRKRDNTPMGYNTLPFTMQVGTGTVGLLPGVTYSGHADSNAWGAQVRGEFQLGENDRQYTVGDRYAGSVWYGREWFHSVSTHVRLQYQKWNNYSAAQPAQVLAPTMDPKLRAGQRLDASIALNYLFTEGVLKNHRLAIEAGLPIYQDLTGPQLQTESIVTVGWQFAFAAQ